MLVSANWIEDFLKEPFSDAERKSLGETLTLHTAEVDAVTEKGSHLKNITVAQIEKIEPHPNADKLRLATVKTHSGQEKVVCGAPNISEGMMVPYAPLGTEFPNGLVLEPKKIRGVVSEGMLCSEAELEISEDHDGIMALASDAVIGTPLNEYLQQTPDVIIDIDNKAITHRPDLWGHLGIARECSAVLKRDFKDRYDSSWQEEALKKLPQSEKPPVSVSVDPSSCCIGYFGISVDNVKVAPSPDWMQERLLSVGLRPINNLVDIGNYVMLEVGGPLHMFDRTRIQGEAIIIRPAAEGETLELLDGNTVTLTSEDTVVADTSRALVVAGIMGGEESGIQDSTTSIFIEAANWERTATRKTSTRLGVRTDSSQRFEKGLDPHQMKTTILRALELVLELCPGATTVGSLVYDGQDLSSYTPQAITCSVSRINKLLGTTYSASDMEETLRRLSFEAVANEDELKVVVPTFRVTREFEFEADVAEEVGRVKGYGSIIPSPPLSPIEPHRPLPIHEVEKKVRQLLPLQGRFLEVETYPLVGEKLLSQMKWNAEGALLLKNPLSVEQDRMRPSMIPSLLHAIGENAKYFDSFRMFEVARSYMPGKNSFAEEQRQACLGVYSAAGDNPFRPIVDSLEALLEHLGVPYQTVETSPKAPHPLIPSEWEGRHPFLSRTVTGFGQSIGEIVEVHPLLLRSLKIKGRLAVGVLNLDLIAERLGSGKSHYEPLSRFPSSDFDCTVVVEPKGELEALMSVLRRFKEKEVLERSILTEFRPTPEERYVTVKLVFGSSTETLSSERIKSLEEKALQHLAKHGYPLKPG